MILHALLIFACTGIKLPTEEGYAVNGRTVEFGIPIEGSLLFAPKNHSFKTERGEPYESKYAVVGTIGFGYPALMDGMNEAGLSVGTFYFPRFANYSKEAKGLALSPVDFPNWILTQFSTIEEVKKGIETVSIVAESESKWTADGAPPPFHYIVYDSKGNALVIEPLEGKLVATENPLGSFTNSPTFDWQMTNLSNYVALRAINADPLVINGVTFAPFGQGSGLTGLPGDFTSPSRFVRATIYSTLSIPAKTTEEGAFLTFHILNQFDIPKGSVRQGEHPEWTQWTLVKDPKNLIYYVKGWDDQLIWSVEMKKLIENGKAGEVSLMEAKPWSTDVTESFKSPLFLRK